MMTQTLRTQTGDTNHLQMNIRLMYNSCFKYKTLIRFDFGQRMTRRDRRIIQARGISGNNPFNQRICNEIATMIAQKGTRKCTQKCRHFRCLRENNNGFEEPTSELFSSPQILHHAPNMYSRQWR